MVYIIIGTIFIATGLILLKLIGGMEGGIIMAVCAVLGAAILIFGFVSINNNDSNDKITKAISTSSNYSYYMNIV